jgi:hypothetical protein
MQLSRAWFAALALALALCAPVIVAHSEPVNWMSEPEWLGQKHLGAREWPELDALVEKLAASGERADDGRFHLYLLTTGIADRLETLERGEQDLARKLEEYRQQVPNSAFEPLLEAMVLHASAWQARGRGLASTVTEEGWALYRERNAAAWELILLAKQRSAKLPTWYELAINIGMDAGIADNVLTAIFNEGIKRFPGYHAIYFNYARQFAPRWGGDYETADAFITAQVAAKSNGEGEVLYTRLYWLIDQYAGSDPDFFEASRVSWQRMRTGFELLMEEFPNSQRNKASFVAYACRARDAATYIKWRQTVHPGFFQQVAPYGISLDGCDRRFMKKV